MSWFHDRSTVTKLWLGFALVAAAVALVGGLGVRALDRLDGMLAVTYERDVSSLIAAQSAKDELMEIARAANAQVVERDATARAGIIQDMDAHAKAFETKLDVLTHQLATPDSLAAAAAMKTNFTPYYQLVHSSSMALQAGKEDDARAAIQAARAARAPIMAAIDTIARSADDLAKRTHEEGASVARDQRRVVGGIALAAVLVALALGLGIGRAIARPLRAATAVLDDVAQGDFTQRLALTSTDEVGQLARSLDAAVQRMSDALGEVRTVSADVASASAQLTAASSEISSGAQEQAASLEETAANLEQITAIVKRNSANAQEANVLAFGSRETAEAGGRVVASTISAMADIRAASTKIADIILTIDEIAFQTNLLALNAAVEAARAGEQGRGFAVVAAEVRNLAQRSAEAAKEIKGLIQDSVGKVEHGSRQVTESGETLGEIVSSVKRLTDIVGEIAAASAEQTTGIEQVNTAVSQMDNVTQANASQTEELSATASTLDGRARQLRELVERFRLDGTSARATAPAPAPVRPAVRAPAAAARKAPVAKAPRARRPSIEVIDLTKKLPVRSTNGNGAGPDGYEEF